MPKAAKRLADIAAAVKGADRLILATDPDREGEAICWHVLEVLNQQARRCKDAAVQRVVFNAITKSAVTEAMRHPRDIDMELVDAYLARRALDYLVGFTLSPVLWRKLPGARSAGRVQSVALRLIVDRETRDRALQDPGILDRRGRRLGRRAIRSWPGWSSTTARGSTKFDLPRRGRRPSAAARGGRGARPSSVAAVEKKPARRIARPALHHLDPAAGSLAQARLLGQAHHAGGPEPV